MYTHAMFYQLFIYFFFLVPSSILNACCPPFVNPRFWVRNETLRFSLILQNDRRNMFLRKMTSFDHRDNQLFVFFFFLIDPKKYIYIYSAQSCRIGYVKYVYDGSVSAKRREREGQRVLFTSVTC